MKQLETIFADFNDTDKTGRVRLNGKSAVRDIKAKGIVMTDGMELLLNDGSDFIVNAVVEFSKTENIWVGKCNWGKAVDSLIGGKSR